MRTAREIAADLVMTKSEINMLMTSNVYGKTQDEMIDMQTRLMLAGRRLRQLEAERDEFEKHHD